MLCTPCVYVDTMQTMAHTMRADTYTVVADNVYARATMVSTPFVICALTPLACGVRGEPRASPRVSVVHCYYIRADVSARTYCVYTRIYIYIYIYMHTNRDVYIYIYMCMHDHMYVYYVCSVRTRDMYVHAACMRVNYMRI